MTSRAELTRLFTGDMVLGLWAPCPNAKLAQLLCERYKPKSESELRTYIYGSAPLDSIGVKGPKMLHEAFAAWNGAK